MDEQPSELKLNTQIRFPFTVEKLPLLGKLYRHAFRSGCVNTPAPLRFISRILFYSLHGISFRPALGRLCVDFGEETRIGHFDARNRQFSALYFDAFSKGYEPEIAMLIDICVPNDGVLYDIGSNWGFFAIYLASRSEFKGQIHAFEPWPQSNADLKRLVNELHLQDQIICHATALSNSSGPTFMLSPSHSGLAHLSNDARGKQIQTTTLDALELKPPTLMKIDAEGAEENILHGGRQLLAKHHPMLIFENRAHLFGEEKCATVLTMLEEIGYRLFALRLHPSTNNPQKVELIGITAETRNANADCANLFACHPGTMKHLREKVEASGQSLLNQ